MSLKFIEIYPGHRWIELDGKRIGELQRQAYGRNLWTVDISGRRTFGMWDCFSLANAKKVAKHHATGAAISLTL